MKCFLCSSPVLPGTETLNPANGFADALRASVPAHGKTLFVCSDPDDPARTARFAAALKAIFDDAGFDFARFDILERRNEKQAARLVAEADFIVLAGGHVPTQNRFFRQIGLKELLRGFDGVLLGISAGSMNCAETVYAQPEEEGEVLDPAYRRFLPGLGLTQRMIIPHYQEIRDEVLDGLRVMEDLAYPDSRGKEFLLLPDGSYLFIENGAEEIRGEAYLLADGKLRQISADEKAAEITVKRYTEREIPAVLAFERRLREEEDDWGWKIDEAYIQSVTASFRDSRFSNSLSFLAVQRGCVIGRIDAVLLPSHFDGSVKAYLDWICVLKSCRHQGAAQKLLSALREELKARGVDTLIALTASNDEAQRFYKAVPDSEMHDIGIWINV